MHVINIQLPLEVYIAHNEIINPIVRSVPQIMNIIFIFMDFLGKAVLVFIFKHAL